MKVKGFLPMVVLAAVLLLALSGCVTLSDLPLSDTEPPIQEEASIVSPTGTVVVFADPVIEAAVRDILEKPDGNITESELLKITILGDAGETGGAFGDISGEITTLSDLKWLKNLTSLTLGDCGIKSLNGVEELKHLEVLRLRRNHISDLEPLRNLVQLKELDLSENPIYDTSALCNLVSIESLGLGDCIKIDLSPVSGMVKLKKLYAPFSNIADISMLGDKTDLEYLQLFHNSISDISSLKELTKLNYLVLSLNNISNIDALDGLPNLEYVSINDNPVPEERLAAFFAPKEQDFFTQEYLQRLGDTDYVIELLAFKSKASAHYQTTKITVRTAEGGTVIQEILPSEYTYFNENPSYFGDDLGFVVEDMNFDGYADIRIIEFLPAGPNIPYTCWVWDKKVGQYVYDSELSAIPSLEVDFENKLIRCFGRASAVEHFEEYYRYIDGSLVRIKEVRTGPLDENDPNQGYSITHELIDGQWVMTEKEKIEMNG